MHVRRIVAIVALLAAGTAGAAACDPDTATRSGPTTSVAAQPATSATADPGTPVPNFVGMGLQAAQDAAQAKGFYDLHSHDASGQGRHQIWDRDWTVCDQTPGAGSTAPAGAKIDMGAVKTDETCPGASATTAPSPSPSPTPATASPRPKPHPTPTHHTATHHAAAVTSGAGGGGSSSGGGSDTSTEPPVDDHGGATALCNDGTLSFSAHHRGTCSHHGGVAEFYQ
ncbi:DUF3761 domain-containing protein [Streptomyces sp. V4-01]|uniref:DUF3761 domain-containing protein n=1 Tax=Actinacidiphila polyblastidii TaxID=3110430 RepID=A0ABU7PBH8_9ACTN|nr:DUF3761 domain-containing protein [Streptomyces sp. V4-01]